MTYDFVLDALHGGKYITRSANQQQVEGVPQTAGPRIIIEWPSKASVRAFKNDPE